MTNNMPPASPKRYLQRYDWLVGMIIALIPLAFGIIHITFFEVKTFFEDWGTTWHTLPPELLLNRFWETMFYMHYQPPLFNVVATGVLRVFPDNFHHAFWILQLIFAGCSAGMLYGILRVFTRRLWLSVVVAFLLACNPIYLINAGLSYYTLQVTFSLVLSLFGVALFQQTQKPAYLYISVVGLSLAILTRSSWVIFLLLPMLVFVCILAGRSWRRIGLVALLISTPAWAWSIKNGVLYGSLTSTGTGLNLWRIASYDYDQNTLRQLVHEGVLSEKIFYIASTPSLYLPLGYDETSDIAVLSLDSPHNINAPAIFSARLRDALTLIGYDPAMYLYNAYRAFKFYTIAPYEGDTVNWHNDWVNKWGWREQFVVTHPITDVLLHGKPLVTALTHALGLITVNSWLFFLLPTALIGMGLLVLIQNRLSPKRWVTSLHRYPLIALSYGYVLYATLAYSFLETWENDRFRVETEPLIFFCLFALGHQFVSYRGARLARLLIFIVPLMGWTGVAVMIDAPYWDKATYSAPVSAEGVGINALFGDAELRLVWQETIDTTHEIGEAVHVTLYWESLKPIDKNYTVAVNLLDANLEVIDGINAILGTAQPPFFPTTRWLPNRILKETYTLYIPPTAPPIGTIYLQVFYKSDWHNALPIVGMDGVPIDGNTLRLQSVGINTAQVYERIATATSQFILDSRLGISILSYPTSVYSGQTITLQATITPYLPIPQDYIFFIHLVDGQGNLVGQSDSPYIQGNWTSSALITNRPILLMRDFVIPSDLPMGDYRLMLGAYTLPSAVRIPLTDAAGVRLADDMAEWGTMTLVDD